MKPLRFISCLLVFVFFGFSATPCFSQSASETFSTLSVEQGLSSVTVTAILKDSKGYLWVGTEDGLNRYNGYSFEIYRNDPANENTLLTNRILAIFEDSEETLWVSTGRGVVHYYDRAADAFVRVPQFSNLIVSAINEDNDGNVWFVGTTMKSLNLRTKQWKDHTDKFQGRLAIIGIEAIEKNDYWVASDTALYRWNQKTGDLFAYFHQPNNPNSLSYNFLYSMVKDKEGNLWIGTRGGGLDKFDVDTKRFIHYKTGGKREDGPLVDVVRTTCLDGDYIWVGTENGGLSKLDTRTEKFTHYTAEKDFPKSLNDNSIKSLYKDDQGRLWIGTFSFGLSVIDPYQNKFSAFKTSYKNTVVNALLRDSKNRLWIGTEGGIIKIENGRDKHYLHQPIPSGQSGIPILSIYEDSDNTLWVGTWAEGLFRYNEHADAFELYATAGNTKNTLSNMHIYALHEDTQNGNLMIGTYLGLNILTSKSKKEFEWVVDSTWAVDVSNNCLRTIMEDSDANIWVGTCGGLKLYDRDTKKLVPLFSGRGNFDQNLVSVIFCLFEDSKKRLWAGTESGLYQIKDFESFDRYTVESGLSNDNIRGILEDEQGKLWLSTSNGMTLFDPEKGDFKNYDDADGLLVNGFKANSTYRDATSGMLFYGGSNGIITFNPSQIIDNPHAPRVALEDFKIFNRSVEIHGEDSILHSHISETPEISLDDEFNIFSIEYAALNLSASNKNQYAYRLVGFDDKWNYVGSARSSTYTNLDPGRYVFEVKASNNDGLWGAKPTSLVINVLPPWWRTLWAYAAYLVIAVALLYFIRRITLIRIQYKNDLHIERVKLENAERLNQAKLQFFTNISHEIRTPLTLILGPIQNLIDSRETDESLKGKMRTINHNAQRLHRLVNQLLDFRKVESGNMKIAAFESNIVVFIEEISNSFKPLADQMNVQLSFKSSNEVILAWFDQDQMEKVIFNLLSNAFKHVKPGGIVSIGVQRTNEEVTIGIYDNGKGIKAAHLNRIFDSFFSYDEGKLNTGTGIGLALSKSLVELHKGSIHVDSVEGVFSKFTVVLPLGKDHFKPTEVIPQQAVRAELPEYHDQTPVAAVVTDEKVGPDSATILLVEDNREVLDYVASILRKSYHVKEACNGLTGFDMAVRFVPDLIITDVMMPEMDGIGLCKKVKEHSSTCHIPVIFLTARASENHQIEGLVEGADDYVTKPFNSKVLMLKVRNMLELRKKIRSIIAHEKHLSIEPGKVAVTPRDEVFIRDVLRFVEENISNTSYSVEHLCDQVAMSKATLFRKLTSLTGQSANEFIRTIRLKRAAQIFSQGDFSVAEVAYMVGFNDPKYFRNCFKKMFNMSPSEYADKVRPEVSVSGKHS